MEIIAATLAIVVAFLLVLLLLNKKTASERSLSQDITSGVLKVVQDSLSQHSEGFLRLQEERFTRLSDSGTKELDGKKQLIDQQLKTMGETMGAQLSKVSDLVLRIEKDREAKFGQLTSQIKFVGEQMSIMSSTTASLREVLASSRARGQWGERMVEDILRTVGFREHINYEKQKTLDGANTRPDFIFPLPNGQTLNMDVKFPLDNYQSYMEANSEVEKSQHRTAFISDVRNRIREVTSREYIDPEQGTLDFVLLFIPIESIYAFIHEEDPGLIEFSTRNRAVMCTPLTLFAILSMIRQAADNFMLQRNSDQVVSLFGRFNEEWKKYAGSVETLGKRLESTQRAFHDMSTTRTRALERPLAQIEEVRQQQGIQSADPINGLPMLPPAYNRHNDLSLSDEIVVDEDETAEVES